MTVRTMRLSLTGRHIDVTPPLRQLVVRRLARIERLLNDSIVSAQVVLTLEKREHRTEILVHARGDKTLSADGAGSAWPQSVGEAIEKIVQQAQQGEGQVDEPQAPPRRGEPHRRRRRVARPLPPTTARPPTSVRRSCG